MSTAQNATPSQYMEVTYPNSLTLAILNST